MSNLKFSNWLKNKLDERGWTQSELSKRTGKEISQSYISLVLADKKPITWDFCAAIALALGCSPIEVFKVAGLLPNNGNSSAIELKDLVDRLPQSEQDDLLKYVKFLITNQ